MEDMDLLAGAIAYKHCRNICSKANQITIVTASVDRIELMQPLHSDLNIRVHGSVVHVGSSSMQVLIRMEKCLDSTCKDQLPPNFDALNSLNSSSNNTTHWLNGDLSNSNLLAEAKFTMVARDSQHRAFQVPKLIICNEFQRHLYEEGERERLERQQAKAISIEKIPPNQQESELIHQIFLFTKNEPNLNPNYLWMSDTHLESTRICHPQVFAVHKRKGIFTTLCLVGI